jgi:hypothetical protein
MPRRHILYCVLWVSGRTGGAKRLCEEGCKDGYRPLKNGDVSPGMLQEALEGAQLLDEETLALFRESFDLPANGKE